MLSNLISSPLRSFSHRRRDNFSNDYGRMMDRFMKDFFDDDPDQLLNWKERADDFMPKVDYSEDDNKIVVSAELPGLAEKEVEVTVDNDVLTIRGEKKDEKEEKSNGRYFSERRYGSFERSMMLPAKVDKEKIAASFDKGVLKVVIPKSADAARDVKKIPIKH